MKIINQPREELIGEELQNFLVNRDENDFGSFNFLVAYVKRSGVVRIKPYLERFREDGGQIIGVVGIDQRNTSFEALEMLLPLCDEIYVYHSESLMQTFHPKVYFFEKEGEEAVVFVGSNNLTAGGLYSNYEIASLHEYDLTDEEDAEEFTKLKSAFNSYSDTSSECCKRLSSELLQQLKEDGYLSTEQEIIRRLTTPTTDSSSRSRIFGSEVFRPPRVEGGEEITEGISEVEEETPPEIPVTPTDDRLVWRRILTRSDAQIVSSGTNPTGKLTLCKAGWRKPNGEGIDQTRYFRYDVFGDFNWTNVRTSPHVEATNVLFDVEILGGYIGRHRLQVRHKPSGEANQNNFTTSLSWGEIGGIIRRSNLVDKILLLYKPAEGEREPFYIKITEPQQLSGSLSDF